MQEKMNILVTGAAGFIGHALCMRLRARRSDFAVTAVDYEPFDIISLAKDLMSSGREDFVSADSADIRTSRLKEMRRLKGVDEIRLDLSDKMQTKRFLRKLQPAFVVHLAALPGVLPSMRKPADYVLHNNCTSTNMLEACWECGSVKHLLLASSSSVYGNSAGMREDSPLPEVGNIYAATKQMDERIAKLCARHHQIPVTAMRFFTVYGPLGRADMAVHKLLASAGREWRPFHMNGDGSSKRSFTYIDDVVEAICRLMPLPPAEADGHFRAVNIGSERAHSLRELIACVERESSSPQFGERLVKIKQLPSNAEEAVHTKADCTLLRQLTGYTPRTSLQEGIKKTSDWYGDWWMTHRFCKGRS